MRRPLSGDIRRANELFPICCWWRQWRERCWRIARSGRVNQGLAGRPFRQRLAGTLALPQTLARRLLLRGPVAESPPSPRPSPPGEGEERTRLAESLGLPQTFALSVMRGAFALLR